MTYEACLSMHCLAFCGVMTGINQAAHGAIGLRRSNPADTVDFHGADAPVQLAEGAAGQKVAVKMVPASKAQQDAAQAAAAAKLPSTNGHSAPIEGLSIKQRTDADTAEKSSRDKPSRGRFCPTIEIFTGRALSFA